MIDCNITSPIAAELAQFEAFFNQTLRADSEPMNSIMRYVADTHGKRLRPILVLLSAKLFGEVNESTLRAATFVEMVHSATLIHDDVVDNDDLRRDQASVKARWDSRSAVLAGDYLLARAILLISRPEDHNILQEMLRTAADMSEGELMQNETTGRPFDPSTLRPFDPSTLRQAQGPQGSGTSRLRDRKAQGPQGSGTSRLRDLSYLDIITRKTATLMRSCCAAGALSVGASPEQVRQFSQFGLDFGILFQLRDDLLDGENTEQAQALLPTYRAKALEALEALPPTAVTNALRDLTHFSAERTR